MKSLTHFISESLNESVKKTYSVQNNIGKSKYVVNFKDGIKQHKDGSLFSDMKIFKNQKDLNSFIKNLEKNGFVKEDTDMDESMEGV